MRALGFADINAGESWLLTPSAAAWEVLTAGRIRIQACMSSLPAASGGTASSNLGATGFGSSAGFAAGLGELPPSGMAAGPPALDTATIQRMTRDPSAMRNMLSNPMVQAMARDNPQVGAAMQVRFLRPLVHTAHCCCPVAGFDIRSPFSFQVSRRCGYQVSVHAFNTDVNVLCWERLQIELTSSTSIVTVLLYKVAIASAGFGCRCFRF